jgi:hypothetical protein
MCTHVLVLHLHDQFGFNLGALEQTPVGVKSVRQGPQRQCGCQELFSCYFHSVAVGSVGSSHLWLTAREAMMGYASNEGGEHYACGGRAISAEPLEMPLTSAPPPSAALPMV